MKSSIWINEKPVLDSGGMLGTKLYSQPEGELVHIRFEPGAHLKAHKTPVNVVFYVVEGTATIQIGEETADFAPDNMIESPKDIPHAITNNGSGILRVLVIKMPKP
ncbi:MAG TPA: cupin domain-containing protein [Candidatus Cloacimonadota bacterium]|nr:cupin domain-containing protein [Candidatus Cloacimonadota bacterium]